MLIVMPFGIFAVPVTFQNIINQIISKLDFGPMSTLQLFIKLDICDAYVDFSFIPKTFWHIWPFSINLTLTTHS